MKHILMVAASLPLLSLCGCSTPGKATLLGAGMGTVAGAGVGMIAPGGRDGQYRARNVIIGGALGGLLGAGSGYVAHELVDKSNKEAFDKGKDASKKSSTDYVGASGQPTLIPPRIETRFVDDQIRGTTFVPAHVEYLIVEPARWQR
jgi:hypothetical protein